MAVSIVNVKTAAKPAPRHIDLTYCMLSQQPNMLIQEGTNTLYAANDVNKTAPLSLMLLLNNVINILFYRARFVLKETASKHHTNTMPE